MNEFQRLWAARVRLSGFAHEVNRFPHGLALRVCGLRGFNVVDVRLEVEEGLPILLGYYTAFLKEQKLHYHAGGVG